MTGWLFLALIAAVPLFFVLDPLWGWLAALALEGYLAADPA